MLYRPDLPPTKLQPGDKVQIGTGIIAMIEEVIWARGMRTPLYLVEYWHEGHLICRRVHEEDCQ